MKRCFAQRKNAVAFDETLRYPGAKEHVPDLCASTEPVGSSRAKLRDNINYWAVTFDETLGYPGAKKHVPDLCAPTEPVRSARASLRDNGN